MMEVVNLLSFRPIPQRGYDVHVHDIEDGGRVLMLDGQIVWQDFEPTFSTALTGARGMADRHNCAMIEHRPYANRSIEE